MKKQIKKLNLNKRTISNLSTPEMTEIVGGVQTRKCTEYGCYTLKGNTCNGNNNC